MSTVQHPAIIIPPVAFVRGTCLATEDQKKRCVFFSISTHNLERRCNWTSFDKEKPSCEEKLR